MRAFAWVVVVLGVLIAVVSPFMVEQDNRVRRQVALERAVKNFGRGPLHQDASPAVPMLVGAGLIAFGVLLLAIRRPLPPAAVPLVVLALLLTGCSGLHVRNALRAGGIPPASGADDAACREEAKAALHPRNWHGGPPAGYARSAGDVSAGVAAGLVSAPAGLGLLVLADARGFKQGYDGARAMQHAEREPVVARYTACMEARGHSVTRP